MQFIGAQRVELDGVDEFGNPLPPKEGGATPTPGEQAPNGEADGDEDLDDDEDFDDEDLDDEDFDDDDGDDGTDDGSGDGAKVLSPVDSPFVVVAFQDDQEPTEPTNPEDEKPQPPTNANTNTSPQRTQPSNPFARNPFGRRLANAPIIGVVSKSKAAAVRTMWGIEKHNEILFIYMPNLPIGPQQVNPQGLIDQDGDGRDDRYNRPPGAATPPESPNP